MAVLGGHARTWLYVAHVVLSGCGGSRPAANSGSGGDGAEAGTTPGAAADSGDGDGDGQRGSGAHEPSDAGARDCLPKSCESLGARCGTQQDGCGGSLDCGTCGEGELCEQSECLSCAPKRCSELGWECGGGSDGCSGTLDCGTCPSEACYEHRCCTPRSCPADACGDVPDGCGGDLDCGACPALLAGKVCGRVSAMVCIGPSADQEPACSCELPFVCDPRNGSCCVPLACADLCTQGAYDGSDGCGATIHCDACPKK